MFKRLVSCSPIQVSPWGREWKPAPVFLPGISHGQRSLAGYSPRGRRVGHDRVCDCHSLTQVRRGSGITVASLAERSFSPTVRSASVSARGDSLSSPGGRQESGLRTDPLVLPPERSPFVHLRCLSAALHRQHVSYRGASRVDGSPQAESVSYGCHEFLYEGVLVFVHVIPSSFLQELLKILLCCFSLGFSVAYNHSPFCIS